MDILQLILIDMPPLPQFGQLANLASSIASKANPIGQAIQLGTSIFGAIQGAKMLKEARKINPLYVPYEINQSAKDMLGRQQMMLNARNPFQAAQTRAILGAQQNANANIARGAVDPAMAMQGFLASSAQADQAIGGQFMQEQQMQAQRDANLMNAQQVMIGEGDKLYKDKMNKYMLDMDRKTALQNAGRQTILNAGKDLASTFIAKGGYGSRMGIPGYGQG